MTTGAIAAFIKHIHVWLVVLSVGGFLLRFIWSQRNSAYLQRKVVKIAPHIVDTLLLLTGVSLALLYRLSPLQADWLGAKLILIVVYIILGVFALKPAFPKFIRQIAGFSAMLAVAGILFLAIYKPTLL